MLLIICRHVACSWEAVSQHRMEMIAIFQNHCSCSGNYSFALKLPSKARKLSYGAET